MKYTSRKFILACATLACSTWLLVDGVITADIWKTVVLGTVGAYIVGNVAQRLGTKADAA